MDTTVAVVIPAYKPGPTLVGLVTELLRRCPSPILIVDDGSGDSYYPIFQTLAALPNVALCRHTVNIGKGGALKTAFNSALLSFPTMKAAITADADGQHRVEDILKVIEAAHVQENSLVLGTRHFGRGVPLRSWFGNTVSRWLYRLFLGIKVHDTQTGLRAIPRSLMTQCLHIRSNRYEFETEQLAIVSSMRMPIIEVPIQTVYENNNASSHFNPLLDSARIYFAMLRYALASLGTSAVDFLVFWVLTLFAAPIMFANISSRLAAMMVQYHLLNRFVFNIPAEKWRLVVFILYVLAIGAVSGSLQLLLADVAGTPVMLTKLIVESAIFIFNFLFLRDILFTKKSDASSD